MVAWSSIPLSNITKGIQLRSLISGSKIKLQSKGVNYIPARSGGHGPPVMDIRETRYPFIKFKNYFHIYALLFAVPTIAWVLYSHIVIGMPKLAAIPEGYQPKHWEYHKHPISRFLSRYVVGNPQERYERNLHVIYNAVEERMFRELEAKVNALMIENQDYQAWYLQKPMAKYKRHQREMADDFNELSKGRVRGEMKIY